MTWVGPERDALATTFRNADPDGPTLCEGWTVRHLLAHLVQREQRPFARAIDMASHPQPGQERDLSRMVGAASTPEGYEKLVQRFVDGPHAWSPMRWAAETLNLLEYVVHHEDVRRAGPTPQPRRDLPATELHAIAGRLPLLARMAYRKSPVSVTLAAPGEQERMVSRGTVGVRLVGDPVELALYVMGRRDAAHVEVDGPQAAVEQFTRWVDR